MKQSDKLKTSAIFRNKIEKPLSVFSDESTSKAKALMERITEAEIAADQAKNYVEDIHDVRESFFDNAVKEIKEMTTEPNKHEISPKEIQAVIQENVAKIQDINGDLENYTRAQNVFIKNFKPQAMSQESWQFTDSRRFFEDCVKDTTHWREADALYNAYAYQLANKPEVNATLIKCMLNELYEQQDAISEQLEKLCRLINLISENHVLKMTEEDWFYVVSGLPIHINEMNESTSNQLINVRKNLEVQLYMNYEQMCLLGKALGFAKGEDEDEDESDFEWEE